MQEEKKKKGNLKDQTTKKVAKKSTASEKQLEIRHSIIKKLPALALAIVTAVTLVVALIGSYGKMKDQPMDEIAKSMEYRQVKPGEENVTGTNNCVKFDAFFLRDLNNDGYAESIRGTCKEIGEKSELRMELNVLTNGHLENGKITISGENFYLETAIPKDTIVRENAIGSNIKTINLNTMNNGTQKTFTGYVCSGDYKYNSTKAAAIGNNTSNYSKKGTVTLTGTYISDDGTINTPITKEVVFDVDWHGKVGASIYNTYQTNENIENLIDEENGEIKLNFKVSTQETEQELILKRAVVEGEIPLLSNIAPKKVECTDDNVTFNYNGTTRKFTVEKQSTLNSGTKIVTEPLSRTNTYNITVTYPLDAYKSLGEDTVEIRIPVTVYYEGYNNTNTEFKNPEVSNKPTTTIIASYRRPQGTVARFDITVGKYVYEPTYRYIVSKEKPLKIYNSISEKEENDLYTVRWEGYTGSDGASTKMVMKETKNGEAQVSDEFIKTDSKSQSMEDVTENIGIYFSNPEQLLGADGEIKVYDDELNELLVTFTKNNWSKYNFTNPYEYERPVKHIRIETSATNKNSVLMVYNIKRLNDEYITKNYTEDAFDSLQYIKSTLSGYVGEQFINTDTHRANYEAPYTIADIILSNTAISTQQTEKNMKITIDAKANETYNQVKWLNGAFLLKLPKGIVDIKINSVTSTKNVEILSYEKYKEGENYYIKVNTENTSPTTFYIYIDCDITPDPTIVTQEGTIDLYYYNENTATYWKKVQDSYDINDNLNKDEMIGNTSTNISLVSPGSLLTSETITNYDNKNSITVAPQVASVEKSQATAKINIQINNNYSSTISEVVILGRVPFTGNKYVINGGSLDSTFNATMKGPIELPDALKNIVKVYYSENGEATKDLKLDGNAWKEKPSSYENVKSYLIDFGNERINRDSKYEISYVVSIPKNVLYNQATYSHHAVYFSEDTTEGKYQTQTEPNKVGLRIEKKYDLELTKYQKNKTNTVQGATYLIKEEGVEEGRTRVTNENGALTLTDLYVDKTYIIKELKSPANYELNQNEIKFKVTEENGILKVAEETTRDNVKNIQVMQPSGEEGYKLQIQVEDEVKAKLKIIKEEQGNANSKLQGSVFKLTGKNFENGAYITTNSKGEATLSGLKLGEIYTIVETNPAEGYYLSEAVTKFKVIDNGSNYIASIVENCRGNLVGEPQTTEENNIPIVALNIDNEKIPRYILKINKVAKGKETPLVGVKFRLFKGKQKIADYTTDARGSITIQNLYQYEESRKLDQTYTLKEILAPDGYAPVKDITFYVTKVDGVLSMQIKEGKIKGQTADNESNTVTITIEDSPSFKLIKKDGETGDVLPGTKFAIYNVDDGTEQLALDTKYNILGEKEIINGKTYYTLTTNTKGEIEADLREGLYKAVEINTSDDKYDLTDNEYFFGIGSARESKEEMTAIFGTSFVGKSDKKINSIANTSDGGYIVGGDWQGEIGDILSIGKYSLTINNTNNGLLIKYNSNNEVQWVTIIGNSIKSVNETKDKGYIVGGDFEDDVKIIKYNINNEIELKISNNQKIYSVSQTSDSGYIACYYKSIIKYNYKGEEEWRYDGFHEANFAIETSNSEYVLGGYFAEQITVNGVTYKTDNVRQKQDLLLKCNNNGEVIWSKNFSCTQSWSSGEAVSACELSDGSLVVATVLGSGFKSKITKYKVNENNVYEIEKEITYDTINFRDFDIIKDAEGLIATNDGGFIFINWFDYIEKYSSDLELECHKDIDAIFKDAIKMNNDEYIAVGCFSDVVQDGKYIFENNENNESYNGVIFRYNIQTAKNYMITDAITINNESNNNDLKFGAFTKDGGYITGETFKTPITIGDQKIYPEGKEDVLIVKYKFNNPNNIKDLYTIEWIKQIYCYGNNNIINYLSETEDGKYIIGVQSNAYRINIGDETVTRNHASECELLIKIEEDGKLEWAKTIEEYGNRIDKELSTNDIYDDIIITSTKDSGCIVGFGLGGDAKQITIGKFKLYKESKKSDDKMAQLIVKYNKDGEVEWATLIDNVPKDYNELRGIAGTEDGGCKVGMYFYYDTIIKGTKLEARKLTIIKIQNDGNIEYAKSLNRKDRKSYDCVMKATNEGGYIIGDNEAKSIVKYNNNDEIEGKASFSAYMNYVDYISETPDGGFIVTGYNETNSYNEPNIHKGEIIIRYDKNRRIKWVKKIEEIDNNLGIKELENGTILMGTFEGNLNTLEIDGNTFNSIEGPLERIIFEIKDMTGVPETVELEVKNYRKEFKITTDVEEIDGKKGGSILGEDSLAYEIVKYGDSNTLDIIMTPEDEYHEIIKITVNGVEQEFTANADGSYTLPKFTNIKENKHIVVTYATKSNKIVVNKVDSKTKAPIEGVEFKIDQIEERSTPPQNVIGALTPNGATYKGPNLNRDITNQVKGTLTANGNTYTEEQLTNVVSGLDLSLKENGEYYFRTQPDGSYVPTNSLTYRKTLGEFTGKNNTTAHSYIKIDLTGKTGKYAVVVNASVSSESSDCGYATINTSQTAPEYNLKLGQFMYIFGTQTAKNYTSESLQGNNVYYLHLGYRKDISADKYDDQVVIHSIKVYEVEDRKITYKFETKDGKYISNNNGKANTTANSYIPINLQGKTGKYYVIVNARVSSESSDYGYATINTSPTAPLYYTSTGQFMKISGTVDSKDYTSNALTGGSMYYLHLGYYKNSYTDYGEDNLVVNSIKVYEEGDVQYEFINKNGEYISNNQAKPNTTANSYMQINLSGYTGKYNLSLKAKVSSQSGDYGYATVTTTDKAPLGYSSTGQFVKVSGTSDTEFKEYSTILDGGQTYYLHLGYCKDSSGNSQDDCFTVKDVRVTLNDSELYHTKITTNSEGKGTTQVPLGRYTITEMNTPDGYIPLENPVTVDFKESAKGIVTNPEGVAKYENEEYVIANKPYSKVTVHHYLKEENGNKTTTRVAQDDVTIGKPGETYQTKPHLELQKYELEKDSSGAYITPDEASGKYKDTDIVVTYYYTLKKIPLTVHHYIVGTENKVPLANGNEAQDETSQGTENERYTTKAKTATELNPKYEFKEVAGNAEGTYQYDEVVVTYYYAVKDSPGVVVHHVDHTTKESIADDVRLYSDGTAKYGDSYATQALENIPANYKLAVTPSNATGTMTENLTEVTYEYSLKDPQITNESIEKTGTTSIETKDEEVTYTVKYNVTVSEYIGKAQITIVDTLPYPIDVSKSDLEGGTYDTSKHTITWQIVEELDTYANGKQIAGSKEKGIELSYIKKIKVVFSSMNYSASEMTNSVSGKIKLYTPEKESNPVTDEAKTTTNFTTELTATKVWNHGNSIYAKPTRVKLQAIRTVDGKDKVEREQIVTLADNKVEGNENRWSYTFTGLPKYDDLGNEIEYRIGEAEAGEGELLYYNTSIDQAQKTVTNTYKGPVISSSKSSETQYKKEYVIEAEKITYTITVRNDGGVRKEVTVQDNIPDGTDFVVGSIKVNNQETNNTKENLASGIKVMVEAGSSSTLSFDVTVNDLSANTFTGTIRNVATVDGKTTDEITNPVKKPNISATKSSEVTREIGIGQTAETRIDPESIDEVKVNDIITYKIKLQNTGEAVGTAIVKDTIPTGTEFVAGSIKVNGSTQENGQNLSQKGADDLKNGISVVVNVGETKTLEFQVKVKDINDLDKITNKATVNNNSEKPGNTEKDTNTVTHTYVEPKISQTKTSVTANKKDYVVEGEKITYTITVTNAGGLAKDVLIKDNVPAGTTLVGGSIKVNGKNSYTLRGQNIELGNKTADDLARGFTVNLPRKAKTDNGSGANGQVTLSFEVTVNALENNVFTKEIKNTATVDGTSTNEEKHTVKKANLEFSKKSVPASGTKVKANDEITYTIHVDNTKGTMAGKVVIKDSIPNGTTFVNGSINLVYSVSQKEGTYTQDNLKNGIEVELQAGETLDLSFKVKVNDIDNLATIKNVAYTKNPDKPEEAEKPTNEITHTYIEPIIKQSKAVKTDKGRAYVSETEKLTYSITVTNEGGLGKDVVIKDSIPQGTSFVAGSIKVNNSSTYNLNGSNINLATKTANDLSGAGITVNVPAKEGNTNGTVTLSFEVTVNDLENNVFTKEIKNTATVDGTSTNEAKNTVKKPNISATKEFEVTRGVASYETAQTVINPNDNTKVKENDIITYRIRLNNKGTAIGIATVKDIIPDGTEFVAGSIKVNEGESYTVNEAESKINETVSVAGKTAEDLKNGIRLPVVVSGEVVLEFKVKVKNINDLTQIPNVATVNKNTEKPNNPEDTTNKVEHTYVEPIIKQSKAVKTERGRAYVSETEKITYSITVTNEGGLGKDVVIKDSIPQGTTFVANSIKVNNSSTYNFRGQDLDLSKKTANDLSGAGITVNVPAKEGNTNGTVTLSFEVTVNDLSANTFTGSIRNIATVDGNNTNDVTNPVKKPNISAVKEETVARGVASYETEQTVVNPNDNTKVKENDIITYRIRLNNKGTAIGIATVKDAIPDGTSFVAGSIKVNGGESYTVNDAESKINETVSVKGKTANDLRNGIRLPVVVNGEVVLEFKVKVNNIDNLSKIPNIATVNKDTEKKGNQEEPTNKVEHTYVEPIIKYNKIHVTERGLNYAVEGEKVTFTIVVENEGALGKNVLIQDEAPEGTTFVPGSIKVNGLDTYKGENLSKKTEEDLRKGISVYVAEKTGNKATQVTLSFKVSINELGAGIFTKQLKNIAKVDGKETNEEKILVNKANLEYKKTSVPETGSKVVAGDEITYRIEVQNTGTAPSEIEIYDTVPAGTTYVEDSLKLTRSVINTIRRYTMEDLSRGIDLKLSDGEKVVVEFRVKVNEGLENETAIRNVAQINGKDTQTTEHIVMAPKITIEKMQQVETGENYAVKGDIIEYNLIVRNTGDLGGKVLIKDTIPEGTSFVEGSIRINEQTTYTMPEEANRMNSELQTNTASQSTSKEANGTSQNATIDLTTLTAKDLQEGIEVYLEKQNDILPTTINLSFKVRVNDDKTGEIKNIGLAKDEQKPEKEEAKSNEVKLPILTIEKKAEITRTTEEAQPQVEEGKVTADDEITYKIIVRNTGEEAATNVIVKDTVPEGTIIKKVNDNAEVIREKDITWVVEKIEPGKEKTLSFTVIVSYSQDETKEIRNTAYIKEVPSNETVTEYQKPKISLVTEVVKDGDKKITTTEGKVYYEITYTGTINYFVGKATITIVDKLPYEIDEKKSDLDGGRYDKASKTITWEETIEGINTYATKQAKVITRTKQISLQYIYEDEENLRGNVENTVTAKTELKEPNMEDPSKDNIVKEEEKEDNHIAVAEIPARVTVHHYFYDKERDVATTVELAPSAYGEGLIGDKYTTSKSSQVPANYECMDENPVNKEGTLTKTPIVVIYYYTLVDEEATVDVTKEAKGNKTVEKGTNEEVSSSSNTNTETNTNEIEQEPKAIEQVEVLTQEGGAVKYKITYKAVIENYIGKAKVTMVDKLPAPIDSEKSDLKGGNYDVKANTITWEEEIEGIDTFAKGTFTKTIEKEITLFYEGQNKAQVLENTVEGKITTYYPDIHPEKPNGEKQNITDEDKEEVEQDYRTDVIVEKRWDDNNNIKEHRPERVRVQVTANGKTQYDETSGHNGENLPNEVLSEENGWSYTFKNLYKYDSEGNEIEYSVTESEVEENDLEYYEEAKVSKVEVTTEQEETTAGTQQNKAQKSANTEGANEVQNSKLKLIVTNTYRLTNTEIDSSITKDGTEEITSSKDEVNYHIEYHAVVKDYIGESTLTITDTLPYKIDEEKSNLKGGTYDEDTQTITWVENLGHINTVENGEKEVSFEKDIIVVYKNLDASKYNMTNTVKGRIEFTENDTKNEKEATHETKINIMGKIILKYVDITTGKVITRKIEPGEAGNEEGQEAIEVPYMYEAESKVGSQYITEQKDIPTYDYVKNSGNTVGHIIEGTIEVIYYYERSKAGDLTVRYVDEEGNDLVPEEKIEGKIEDPYKTEPKDIENYELESVTGDEPEGKLGEEPKEVVYHYKKIPAKVIVRFLEKPKEEKPEDTETNKPTNPEEGNKPEETEPKVLAPEEKIEGYVGDHYETKRKAIENYRAAEPEPENSIGKMEKNDNDNTIYVTYYYEKIPSGKITVKHVDVDTDEEISYMEDGERKTYREEIQGYVGEEYKTEEKEIPYYKYLKELEPKNKNGIYKEEDDTVLYYYKKLDFNFKVDKQIRKITINGEEMEIRNNKLMKVEVVASKISSTNIELTYSIVVTNTGEIAGKAQIEEIIPTGLKLSTKTPEGWQKGKEGVLLQEVELNPGESKELLVVLEWIKENSNFRNMRNEARIQSTQNIPNYEETNKEDNSSIAEVVISVKTGAEKKVLLIILEVMASCGALVLLYEYQLYQKQRNREIRHVVLDGKNVVIVKKKQK